MANRAVRRALKVVGITVGALVALMILLPLAAWLLVNPNAYKGRIEQSVQHSTGRTLALAGDIKLSVFPSVSLELGPASLGNPPGFGSEPFASVRHASLQVRLLPLLHKQLQVGHVEVDGLDLRLKTNAQGQGNWVMSTSTSGTAAPPASSTPSSSSSTLPEVADIAIKNSRLSYQDETAENVTLTLGRIAAGATVPVSFRLDLKRTPTAPPIALSGRFDLALDADAYRLGALKAQLDSTRLRGGASVGRSAAAPISFDLTLDQIDLDHYLGTGPTSAQPQNASSAPSAPSAPTELPTDSLKTLELQGKLAIGSARFEGLTLSQINVGLSADHGLLRISPDTATLYGGSSAGTFTLDARPALPVLKLDQSLTGVDVQPLLSTLLHNNRLAGRGNLTLNLSAQGKTTDALIRSLNGRVSTSLVDGAVAGVDLQFEVQRALALFQPQAPVGSDRGETQFDTFRATHEVAQGIATTKDLTLTSRQLRVTGQGSVNLATQAMNYRLQAELLKGALGATANAATGALVTVPLDVTGTVSNIKLRPDLAGLAKSNLNQLKQQLQKKLPGLLNRLFGH